MIVASVLGGVTPVQARVAALGYLLPIHAHSAVEIMAAAAAHGVPFSASRQMYRNIQPFSTDVLRSRCGLTPTNAEGQKRFPDEPEAPPAAGTPTPPPAAS